MTTVFKVNNIDYTTYLLNSEISNDIKYGSASGRFSLNNNDGRFNLGGTDEIAVGSVVTYSEYFTGDDMEFKNFYGYVAQTPSIKSAQTRSLELICLDFVSSLQHLDIDLEVEGTKIEVENEI